VSPDESHVTVPQIGGMFKGDLGQGDAGGIRIPAAVLQDNRPLRFEEWA